MTQLNEVNKKIATAIAQEFCNELDQTSCPSKKLIDISLKYLNAKDKETEWVSVKTRLPESGDEYLVILNHDQIIIATWVACYWACGVTELHNVTHWQPKNLPKPPKKEE